MPLIGAHGAERVRARSSWIRSLLPLSPWRMTLPIQRTKQSVPDHGLPIRMISCDVGALTARR